MYKYRIYGLHVLSDRPLDCYPHDFEVPDLVVRFTDSDRAAKQYIDALCDHDKYKEVSAEDGFGRFYFCGEKNIVVYYQNADYLNRFLMHCLLGFAFSYILMQRRLFFLHGSSVVVDNAATILIGSSGAGKSSAAAGLVLQGGQIIADDMTRLELNAEPPFVYPGYPVRRLYGNILEYLGISLAGASELISKKGKFSFTDENQNCFRNQEVPVKAIVRVTPADTNAVRLAREDIKSSISIICGNVYNYANIHHTAYMGDYLDFALNVCNRIPVYTLYRPREILTVKEQVRLILKEIYHKDVT